MERLTKFEEEERRKGVRSIAGVDEAGRGPLAGPVVAAACILPETLDVPEGINDSKKLTPQKRESLFEQITQHPFIHYSIGIVSSEEIDSINILQATIKAMLQAVDKLPERPDILFVDGMELAHEIPSKKIIKGDARSVSIAAASILAKVTRDRLMNEYHLRWPDYNFKRHKGYGTEKHREAIKKYGVCPIHRLTFAGCIPRQFKNRYR